DWKRPFDEELTEPRSFHATDGTTVMAPTMRQKSHFAYGEFDGYKMLEMPYAGDDLSMVIILPDEVNGLAGVEESFSAEQMQEDLDSMRYREVIVDLPKFTFEDKSKLADP